MPESIMGMGDIVYWKDGREVYDSVNVTYRYSDGVKIAYESLISPTSSTEWKTKFWEVKEPWKWQKVFIIWKKIIQLRVSGN